MSRDSDSVASLAADLRARLDRLIEAARREGRDEALAQVQALVSGAHAVKRGPGRPRKDAAVASAAPAEPRKRRRNPWAGLSPEARLARVNAIRKGKGLPPKEKL